MPRPTPSRPTPAAERAASASALTPAAADSHAALHAGLRWPVSATFNIAQACGERWAIEAPDALAIVAEDEAGPAGTLTRGELWRQARHLAAGLRDLGVGRGDRVALVLPQRPETAVAHLAVYALGAVAVPLTQLFGPEALAYRLQDSGAVLAIADESAWGALAQARAEAPALRTVVAAGAAQGQGRDRRDSDWATLLAHRDPIETALATRADAAAVLIYTSGTTGPPKGALIPHRALLGNLSGFVCSQNGCPQPGDVFWSPADWAWTGGLMDALLPCLYLGVPIVALRARFTPERAFALMARHRVTNTFLFPTALKAMMKALPRPRERFDLHLRAVMSAGEAVGDAVYHWCEQALGVTVNEMFGQTEVNYIVGNCQAYAGVDGRLHPGWPARPGSMGRAYPGHRVAVIDDAGRECPRGTPGDVALHRLDVHGQPDPVFFLGYWRRDDATRAKFSADRDAEPSADPGTGADLAANRAGPEAADESDSLDALGIARASWCRTGDIAVMDADGYLWYQGRSDDVFKAAGYRIGPSEVENCLVKHPAVANAVVVPKPDAERGALVKAYVVLAEGHAGSDALVAELQAFVRGRLAPYEYPKEIEFIDALPMTTTGKVQRRVLRLQEEARAAQHRALPI